MFKKYEYFVKCIASQNFITLYQFLPVSLPPQKFARVLTLLVICNLKIRTRGRLQWRQSLIKIHQLVYKL